MIKSGTFFLVPLEKNYGFSLIKIFWTKDIDSSVLEGVVMVSYRHKQLTLDLNVESESNFDYLTNPIILHSLPRKKSNIRWVNLDKYNGNLDNFELCDYKDCGVGRSIEEQRIGNIMTVRTSMKGRLHLPVENVIHLPVWAYFAPEIVSYYLTMEWIRQECKNIDDFFSKEEFDSNNSLKSAYALIVSTMPFNEIPLNINPSKAII